MPLLLALEPDARQATSLTTLVPAHLSAELVVAATADAAVAALRQRRPDLVLAASGISPAETAALMAGLGSAVPVLAIPVLADAATPPRGSRGLLTRLRRPRRRRGADTCEPAAFAAQIAECLGLADAVRRAYAEATIAPAPGSPMLSAADAAATVIDLQVFADRTHADDPVVANTWLDLEPYLDDESKGSARSAAGATGAAEPDVIELPPPGELWAQLVPGYAARMAPLEGPSMLPHPQSAAPRDASVEMETADPAGSPPRLLSVPATSDRPKQDEWGLYDPEQCGFAALLLRLEELADDDRRDRDNRSAIMRR